MTLRRTAITADVQALQSRMGFPYPAKTEACWIVDSDSRLIAAFSVAVKLEGYLAIEGSPAEKMLALEMLHGLGPEIRAMGFDSVDIELPPEVGRFGRRLRKFGWIQKIWEGWFIRV